MKWPTQFDHSPAPSTESGTGFEWTWKEQYDEKGVLSIVHDKIKNVQEEIQSHADSVNLELLIARYENGDFSALNQREPSFADIIDVPNSYADVLNIRAATKRYFYDLPVEVRKEFNHDFDQFAAQLGSDECSAILDKFRKENKVDES